MIQIGVILGTFAITFFVSMMFLTILWSMRKSLKTFLFRRRLYRVVPWVSLLLVTAIIANAMMMRLNGFNASLIILIPAVGSMFLGFMACGVLRRNFIQQVKIGLTCSFVISSFTTKEVYGYAVIDDVWFDAEADVDVKRIASLKEKQQITAVICKACPDNPLIIVRF